MLSGTIAFTTDSLSGFFQWTRRTYLEGQKGKSRPSEFPGHKNDYLNKVFLLIEKCFDEI